jgi:glycosyltransferase involved in cell wall biosynthesis
MSRNGTLFSVVTPCYNAGSKLLSTARSVLSQRAVVEGRVDLEYVVVDGGSTDGSIDELMAVYGHRIKIISEPDRGMYDALVKGFRQINGDIHSYINAGDLYHEAAFDAVASMMARPDCDWVMGSQFFVNDLGQVISFRVPYRYRRRFIRNGLHGTFLPAVQQESTFWSGRLTSELDLHELSTYRLAGDHFIWCTFSERHELFVARAYLGGFTYHGDHLSAAREDYRREMARHRLKPRWWWMPLALLDRIVWKAPDRVKSEMNRRTYLSYDRLKKAWVLSPEQTT